VIILSQYLLLITPATCKCAAGQFNQWKKNPWTTGNSATDSHGGVEPAGYTSLVYPPRPGIDIQTRFVPSIRWELLRKGTEDAERMLLLQQLLSKCKPAARSELKLRACPAAAVVAGEAALAAVGKAVWGFPLTIEGPRPATTAGDTPYAEDETGVRSHALLDSIASAILALQPSMEGIAKTSSPAWEFRMSEV